jgi:hypothetical protein
MNFNNACFYTAIANLLEHKDIDIEDTDIIKNTLIPYIFRYNKKENSFIAGYEIQDLDMINGYLSFFNVVLKEEAYVDRIEFIAKLKSINKPCIIPVLLDNKNIHSVIFEYYINVEFRFKNTIREIEKEANLIYTEKQLLNMLPLKPCYAYLEKTNKRTIIDKTTLLNESIEILLNYQEKINHYCNTLHSYQNRVLHQNILFRALLLNYLDMVHILEEKELYINLKSIQKSYIRSFQIKEPIKLSSFLDMELLNNTILQIKDMICTKLNNIQ